jgi:hypothetical protein
VEAIMAEEGAFRVTIQRSLESDRIEPREGITHSALTTTPHGVLEAPKATLGFEDIVKDLPGILDPPAWTEIASFKVCGKTGSAYWLDIWDADHFDGFTDMQRCVSDCRAWFSAEGFASWGSAETSTGRVNCYFNAPAAGNYLCTAGLQSYPTGASSMVECLIDNSSFGPLPFSGTIYQPHPCTLASGGHSFRIRQLSGSFFFLSLVVYRV